MYTCAGFRILIKLSFTLLIHNYKFKLLYNNIIFYNNLIST